MFAAYPEYISCLESISDVSSEKQGDIVNLRDESPSQRNTQIIVNNKNPPLLEILQAFSATNTVLIQAWVTLYF